MRDTFELDDDLVAEAQRITGMTEPATLTHEGLRAVIERESARRIARLGGTEVDESGVRDGPFAIRAIVYSIVFLQPTQYNPTHG